MTETAEIHEPKNPFERRVALTVACIVLAVSVFHARDDHAKTQAILLSTRSADTWAHYQAKSVKQEGYDLQGQVLAITGGAAAEATRTAFAAEVRRYAGEKDALAVQARELDDEVTLEMAVNRRCDWAVLVLELAAVLCSLAILVHWRLLWLGGLVLAVGGVAVGASSFVLREAPEAHGGDAATAGSEHHAR